MIHPHKTAATSFQSSTGGVGVYLNASSGGTTHFYQFNGGVSFALLETISGTGWQKTSQVVARISTPIVVVPSATSINAWTTVGTGVTAATLSTDGGVTLSARKYTFTGTTGKPFDPVRDWTNGPGDSAFKYSTGQRFYPVSRSGGSSEGVLWQAEDNQRVHITWLTETAQTTVALSEPAANSDYILQGSHAPPCLPACLGLQRYMRDPAP